MKNVYLLFASMLLAGTLYAKGGSQDLTTAGPVVNGPFPHFNNQVGGAGAGSGTTAPSPTGSLRLVAKTYSKYSGASFVPVDSTSYWYQGERGGLLNNDNIDNDEPLMYSESLHFVYNANSSSFENRLRKAQDYYTDGKVKYLTYQPWRGASGTWKDSARYAYNYDGDKMVASTLEQFYANMWTNGVTSGITYNGQNVTMESPGYRVAYQYSSSALVEIIDEQKVGGVWQYNERHTYEYSGQDVTKHVIFAWDNSLGIWVNEKMWQYNNANGKVLSETELEWNNGAWVNVGQVLYTYDNSNNLIVKITTVWSPALGNYIQNTKQEWEYDQGVPKTMTTYTWGGNTWMHSTNDKQYRFYYERYYTTSIPDVAATAALNIYPVPATDVVHVEMDWNMAQNVTMNLRDAKGAIIYSATETSATQYQGKVDVSNLPAGIYFVQLAGDAGLTATKRIAVMH